MSIDDCSPTGRMEFDAIARFLQDVGNDDTDDAGFGALGLAWVARRAQISVQSVASAREDLTLSTWCSGTGRRWAERRTSISGESGARVEGVTIWIHLDPTNGKPAPWGDEFANAYLPASNGRQIDARLRLPKAPTAEVIATQGGSPTTYPWKFRKTDEDGFGHVNNTAYLAVAEEFFDLDEPCDLQIEWRSPCLATNELTVTVCGNMLWVIDAASGDTRCVISRS